MFKMVFFFLVPFLYLSLELLQQFLIWEQKQAFYQRCFKRNSYFESIIQDSIYENSQVLQKMNIEYITKFINLKDKFLYSGFEYGSNPIINISELSENKIYIITSLVCSFIVKMHSYNSQVSKELLEIAKEIQLDILPVLKSINQNLLISDLRDLYYCKSSNDPLFTKDSVKLILGNDENVRTFESLKTSTEIPEFLNNKPDKNPIIDNIQTGLIVLFSGVIVYNYSYIFTNLTNLF